MRKLFMIYGLAVGALAFSSFASTQFAAGQTIYGNGTFTNASTSNQGQAVSGNWYFNNVRNSGVVGITQTYSQNGNGSVFFQLVNGPGGNSSKADIEFLSGGVNLGGNYYASTSLGSFGDLTHLSYDWYRDGSSTANGNQHPSVRIMLDADGNLGTTNDRGYLIFEKVYNGLVGNVAVDQWVSEDVFAYNTGNGAYLWNAGFGPSMPNETGGYNKTLTDWRTGFAGNILSANSAVLGFSMGVGSGWAPFVGAVDNFSYGFSGNVNTFNFEAVPEPTSALYCAMVLGGLGVTRLRRRRA